MAGSTGKQLNQRLNLTVNTAQARQQLQSLYTQLNSITKGTNLSNGLGITNQLIEANKAAAQLKATLAEALNPNTGNLNLTAFSDQLRMQNMSLEKYRQQLANLGTVGDKAFTSLAKSIVTAEAPITRLGKWGQELTTTLGNTVRWQLTSSLLHGVMSTASQAMNYVKNLDSSLNNIRIVTGQSDEQMQRFARTANAAAKALNTTTNAYAQASLIYYQQGLSDKQVQERTAATIKLANVSGQTAAKVSDQMTAVWNNFYDGSKSLEYYIDVMTALGASTASSTQEISKGLEKFASIAQTTGLSYEYATSALSTVVAATRQSADSVGTSFKTLFSRLQGLSLGETLEDGTTLNKYSKALNTIGVNIKNANGSLKDMDNILNEIGEKWTSLTKAEQVALAQTVGGARNYTGLVSLMDNWDEFQKNLQTAQNAQGTLQRQADIYAESWEAASKHVRAASETIYKNLLDDKFFKGLTNGFGDVLDVIGAATNAMGGFKGVMALATSFATTKFAPQVSQGISDIGLTLYGATPWGRQKVENLRQEAIQQMIAPGSNTGSQFGAVEQVYKINLAERSEAYRLATKQGRIQGWQQPIYQQLLQNVAQQEDTALKMYELAQQQRREGENYSYQLQRQANLRFNSLTPQEKALLSYNTGASGLPGNRPQAGTMQAFYKANIAAATGLQYASRLNEVLLPFNEGNGISLNNIQNFMGTLQTLSDVAGKTANGSITRLFGLDTKSSFNIDSIVGQMLAAYNNAGGKVTTTNQGQFSNLINQFRGQLSGATEESRGLYFDERENFEKTINQLYASDPRMAQRIIDDFHTRTGNISGAEAEHNIQQQNALKSHQFIQNMISGTKGTMSFADTLTTATSAATTIGYSYLQAANAVKIFSDETSTATDKMGALVGVGMTLPNTIQASTNLLQSFGKTLGKTGISGGLASLAIAAAIGGGVYLNSQYKTRYENNTLEAQAKQASQQAVTTKQVATSAQEAYDSFIAISENQAKAQQEIYNNINGSSAQTLAIINANQQAIEMISKYGLTSDQWSIGALGEISIDSSVKKEVEDQLLEESKDATTNALISNLTASLVQNLNEQEAMSTRGVYRVSGLEQGFSDSGYNVNTNDIIAGWYQYAANNPNATFEQYAESVGLTRQRAQVHGFRDEAGNINPFTIWGGIKEYAVNTWYGKNAYNQFAENLGLSPYASFEEVQKAISTLDLTKENNELEIKNYTQGIISAVAANNKEYSEEIKQLAAIYATEQINSNEIYELAREGLRKDNKTEEEKAIYRELYNKEADETYDETTLQGLIIAKRINDNVEEQLNNIYANIEEEGKVFKSYTTLSRESLSRTLAENAENKYADLIRQKQIDSDRSLYEALIAQMPINSFSTDLKDFQNWLSEQDMSIQTQQQLESYIIDFGTTFGEETVKWVYDNFTGDEYSKEFRASFKAALDKTDLTGGAISNLYNIRRTSRSYADVGSDAAIKKNLNTLYEKAINDLGGDAGLLTSLLNSSDFASVLGKLTSSFEITGQLTADQIQAAAAKSEILSQFLDISNVNTGGLATVIRELSSGNLNINQVSTPLLQAFSTAAAPESQRIRGISALTDFDYADSIESAFTQYFKDTKKAISPGWYGGVFYDAPINQFLSQMSTSNQEKYRANVTRMINEGWTTKQFQNQLKADAPELYNYIGKVTSKKGADEFDMFDMMNSEDAFNGPMTYDSKTGQLRYDTDYWTNNPEAEAEYAKWFKENGYGDLVNPDGTLKDLGATQRATQAMMAYQFRHVYSGTEADRKAEYIATYMHDAGNGPMWDKNAAIQGAKDLANSGLVFDDQYRAYFNENAALLGYEPTEEGYQKFVKDYFTIQKTVPTSNIPGTNTPRGVTTITQATTPINREALKNITNLEDLNNVLTGHMTGVLNGGSGLDTLLNLRGAVLDENGTLDYDKTRQILEEELGLAPEKIDTIMKEKAESGSVFSKLMYNSKTGTYEPVLSSESGWVDFRNQIENPEKTNEQKEQQDNRDFALETELDLLEGQEDKNPARIALFNRMSEEAQDRYRESHPDATWIPTKTPEGEPPSEEKQPPEEEPPSKEGQPSEGGPPSGGGQPFGGGPPSEGGQPSEIVTSETGPLPGSNEETNGVARYEEIKNAKETVVEAQADLDDALLSGDTNAIHQAQDALAEAQSTYTQAIGNDIIQTTKEFGVAIGQGLDQVIGDYPETTPLTFDTENVLSQLEEEGALTPVDTEAQGDENALAFSELERRGLLEDYAKAERDSSVPLSYSDFLNMVDNPPTGEPADIIPDMGELSTEGTADLTFETPEETAAREAAQKAAEEQAMLAEQYQKDLNNYNAMSPEQQANVRQMIFEQGNDPILGATLSQFAQELYTQMSSSPVYNMPEQTVENEDTLEKWALDAFNTLDELGFEDLGENFSKINFTGDSTLPSAYEYLQAWLQSQDTETAKALAEQLKIDKLIAENTDITAENTTTLADTNEEEEAQETQDQNTGKTTGDKKSDKDKDIFGNTGGTTIINEGGGDSGSGGDEGWWPGKPGGPKNDKVYFGPDRFNIGVDLPGKTGGNGGRGGRSGTVPSPSKGSGGGNSGDNSKIEVRISLASGQNNARLLGYAKGKEGHIAVTGELGPELRVKSDGSMDLLGKTGREYTWVDPSDKIYTANQTASILGSNNSIPQLDALSKGINNYIPGYADAQTYVGTPGRPSGSSGGGGGGGGGSRGGGGGAATEKDPRYDPDTLKIRDILERYYTILQQIDNITKAVERFSKVADRAWGRERIRAIEHQNELQQKQYEAQKKYIAEIEGYLETDQSAMTTMIREFVEGWNKAVDENTDPNNTMEKISWAGAQFDQDGVLTNYRDFVEKLVEQYNQNAASANQETQYKFQEQLKDIQMYTDTLNLYEEQINALEDIKNAILDTAIKVVSYEVEYKLELSGDTDRILNFQADKYKDDVYQAAKYLELLDQRADLTRKNLETVTEGIMKTLGNYAGENMRVGALHTLDELGVYGTNKFEIPEELLEELDEDDEEDVEKLKELQAERSRNITKQIGAWLEEAYATNKDEVEKIEKMLSFSSEEGAGDFTYDENWRDTYDSWEDYYNEVINKTDNDTERFIDNYEEIIGRLNGLVDFQKIRTQVSDWLEELRTKDAEAAAEIDKIIRYTEDGQIANYSDVLEKLNEANVKLNDEFINLLYTDQEAFFKAMSDFQNNPGWVDFTTEHKDQLTNWMDAIYQYLESLQDTYEQTIEQLGDSIKATAKQMDAAVDEFDYYGDVYKTFGNIVDLTNRHMTDVSQDFFNTLNNKSMDNSINKIKATVTNYHLLQNELAEVTKQYNEMQARANAATGEEQIYLQQSADKLKEQLDIANNQYEDAHKAFLSSWEDALSKMAENYKAAVEEAAKNFEQGFSPLFNTLALLQAQFDREKALGDLYVDNYQRIHDLNKLNRDIQLSIDDTDNLKGKERLRDLQAEINQLQEDGTELSEYDLNILDKKYKLELARQALEDAKDAKSMVRLARDNNGNWSYVYTANQDDVEKAEQDYEDAIREMEQANEDYIDSIQDQILQVQQEAQQAILALQPEDFATYEDYLAAVNNIQNSMYQTLDFLRSQLNNAFGNNEWLDPYIVDRYGINDHDLTTDFGDTTLAGLLDNPDIDKAIKKAKENFEDNLKQPILDAFIEYSERQDEVYQAAEHDIATIGKDFQDEMENIADSSEYQVEVVTNLFERVQNSFNDMAAVVDEKTKKHLDEATMLVDVYEKLVEAITKVKELSGENLPIEGGQFIGKIDSWAEIQRLNKELAEHGDYRTLEDLTELDPEDLQDRKDAMQKASEKIGKWMETLLVDSVDEETRTAIQNMVEKDEDGLITNYKQVISKLAQLEKTDENKDILKEIKKWRATEQKAMYTSPQQVYKENEGLYTNFIAGDQFTKDYISWITDQLMYNQMKTASDNGVTDTEKAEIETYLSAHGGVWVKKGDIEEFFDSWEDWKAWYEKNKYVAPSGGGGGGGDSGWAWWEHHTSDGGYIDTQGAVGYDTGGFTGRWQSADTGMYTGEWSSGSIRRNGKLAWLHQKELVLNAHDTENFLDAMKIVKQLDNLTNWMANGLGDLIIPKVTTESGELEQNVHIEAEFPNVTDHNEIEQAFNNLVNMASQYANRK